MAVVHHPASHPYIAHIQLIPSGWQCHPEGTGLPDPDALCTGDVVHLHFGFEHIDAHTLATWVGRLRRRRVALVYTAHDLDNPHLEDQSAHHAALDVVAGAASAIVALTPWAAAELQRRTGAAAVVIPHPHVVPLEEVARRAARPWPAERGVYVHAATLRPNLDLELVARVAGEARCFGGLRVHVRASSLTSATPAVRSWVVRPPGSTASLSRWSPGSRTASSGIALTTRGSCCCRTAGGRTQGWPRQGAISAFPSSPRPSADSPTRGRSRTTTSSHACVCCASRHPGGPARSPCGTCNDDRSPTPTTASTKPCRRDPRRRWRAAPPAHRRDQHASDPVVRPRPRVRSRGPGPGRAPPSALTGRRRGRSRPGRNGHGADVPGRPATER